ncbi:HmuY family protein [Marinomonas sp. 15G1-11]|uniref:HmuY family protein n=1 Tax=Marinomonas phaeophyticola TaxID=3004091 RepID=A0ABT4JSD4_9GAMM|nr:HmuY family protein [Marinomonas sp. 15G1-11]MCZ2721285.1 HmuY family protein [Marinomonas sp. 15G1-11]
MSIQFKRDLPKRILYPTSVLLGSIVLVACGGGSDGDNGTTTDPETHPSSLSQIIDASDYTEFTYFNLNTNNVVELTEEEAKASTDWHIGFRRSSIILNGGTSGGGQVAGALAVSQEGFYQNGEADPNVFLNASPEAELEHLTADIDLSSLSYQTDTFSYAITGSGEISGTTLDMGWYNYDFTTHAISANTNNMWLLKSAAGDSYARFSTQTLEYGDALKVTFVFDVQTAGTNQFVDNNAVFTASIPNTGGKACFDFDNSRNVDCETNTDWDVQLVLQGRDFILKTNSGPSGEGSGGAFGPFLTTEKTTYVSGTTTSAGTDISRHYLSDSNEGIFSEQSWYAYNLSNGHKLWPNYRVYVIDTDQTDALSPQYKLQITNYYSDTGVSGYPNIRFQDAN